MLFDPNSPDVPLRHMCRNPHCGAQLKTPAANSRDAFCCEGCHEIYYRIHCRVCEQLFRSKNRRRTVCGRSSCRHEFQRHPEQFWGSRYPRPRSGHNEGKSLAKSTPKTDVKSDREWRQVAGPKLSETGFRAAVLGADELPASAANTAFIEYQTAALRRAQSCRFNPDTPPVNIVGGYRFPNAPLVDLSPLILESPTVSISASTAAEIPADLSIPDFLRRTG